jgi:hypothetical protein
MKSAISLTLAASLLAPSLPAQAQPRYTYQLAASDWSQVRALPPGSKVTVRAVGLGGQDGQYFVSATDNSLTLLLPGNVSLPRSAKRLVIGLAATHPELFTFPGKWMEFADGSARANPDGVFVHGRKVADLSEITRAIDAGEVAEVARQVRAHRRRDFGASPAEGVAALIPFLGLSFLGCHSECGRAAVAVAAIGGPIIAGAIIAARKADYTTEVVYRAR